MDSLLSHDTYLAIPLATFAGVLQIQVFFALDMFPALISPLFAVSRWLYFVGALLLNIWFAVLIYPFSSVLFGLAVAFLVLWFVGNLVYTVAVAVTFFRKRHTVREVVLFMVVATGAVFNLSAFHLLGPKEDFDDVIVPLSTSLAFYQSLPLVIIQGVSLSLFAPVQTFLAIFFNALSVLLALSLELFLLFPAIRRKRLGRLELRSASFFEPSIEMGEASRELEKPERPEESPEDVIVGQSPAQASRKIHDPSMPLLGFFSLFVTVLVAVSLVPHCVSLVGLPFAWNSIRRFHKAISNPVKEGASQREEPASWHVRRGYFLIFLNVVSFIGVMFILLPILSVAGLLLFSVGAIPRLCGRPISLGFGVYQATITHLVASLLFCYLPFLDSVPVLVFSVDPVKNVLRVWHKVAAVFWFLAFEVAMPLIDVITDFQFSFQLLVAYSDPRLENRDQLFKWIILSFIASSEGAVYHIIKWIAEIVAWSRIGGFVGLVDLFVSHSPFSLAQETSVFHSFFALWNAGLGNLLQALVACFTVGFLGQVGTVWAFKLGLSLFSLCFAMSKLFTTIIFGKRVSQQPKVMLQALYFLLFGIAFALAARYSIANDFCDLNRTVNKAATLTELSQCSSISANLVVTQLDQTTDVAMSVTSLTGALNVTGNLVGLTVGFTLFETLSSPLAVISNPSTLNITFDSLKSVTGSTILEVTGNSDLALGFSALFLVDMGSGVVITNNTISAGVTFPALVSLLGDLSVESNTLGTLSLPTLLNVPESATVEVTSNSLRSLQLPSLNSILGNVSITDNTKLTALDFPTLSYSQGLLQIASNPQLTSITFDIMDANDVNILVTGNPALLSVSFPSLVNLFGNPVITGNALLEEINLPMISTMFATASLTISSNPSLQSLNLTSLDCYSNFRLFILDNAGLETVYMGEPCLINVHSSGNPLLTFETF